MGISSNPKSLVTSNTRSVILSAFVMVCCAGLFLIAGSARPARADEVVPAAGTAIIAILPVATSVDVGGTVTVEVWLQDVENFYGIDLRISFNPALLSVPSGSTTPLWEVFDSSSHFLLKNTADNDAGTLWLALTNVNPAEPFTGSGRVCTITFSGLAAGTSALEFYYAKGSTKDGGAIYPSIVNGTLTVGSGPPVSVSPTATSSSTATYTVTSTATHTATHTVTPAETATATVPGTPSSTPTTTPTPQVSSMGAAFHDLNGNGREDAGEPRLGGRGILLYNTGTYQVSTVYTINNVGFADHGIWYPPESLPAGNYEISQILVPGWEQTHPDTNDGIYYIDYHGWGLYDLLSEPPAFYSKLDFGSNPEGESTATSTATVAGSTPTPTLTATATSTSEIIPVWTSTATPTDQPGTTPTSTPVPQTLCLGQGVAGYTGCADTYLDLSNASTNYGNSDRLYAKTQDIVSILGRFDLSMLPAGADIQDARLTLSVQGVHPEEVPITLHAYRLLRDWSEEQATWVQARDGVIWGMAGAQLAGVDYLPDAIDEQFCIAAGEPVEFDLTDAVRFWLDNPEENYGFILKAYTCQDQTALYAFWSGQAAVQSLRPELCVRYAVDPPTPTPTHTATPTSTWTATATFTHTPTPSITATWTVTPTPTATATASSTATPSPTATTGMGAIRGVVWNDMDGSLQVDPGEPYLADAVLNLYRNSEFLGSRVTGTNGYYRFDGLTPGNYLLIELDPPGYTSTTTSSRVCTITSGQTLIVNFGDWITGTPTPTETVSASPTSSSTPTATATPEVQVVGTPTATATSNLIQAGMFLPLLIH